MQSLRMAIDRLKGGSMTTEQQKPLAVLASKREAPQIAEFPTITSSGSMVWGVRDILFGPHRLENVDFQTKKVAPATEKK